MNYKVGTRSSKLAMRQTKEVIDRLKEVYPEDSFEIVTLQTTGDKKRDVALEQIGTKGLFVDEIEKALLGDDIQLAVHSMKDMPEDLAPGLVFAKAWKREDPRDVLILREATSLEELPRGALIATGSKRREFQLKRLRPDLRVVGIRGNIDTRIRKLQEPLADGTYLDGIVLAAAGLHRLGLEEKITQYLDVEDMIPAPAQGILALEVRGENQELLDKLNALSDEKTQRAAQMEREFLKSTGGNCRLPIGAYLEPETNRFYTLFGNEDGSVLNRRVTEVSTEENRG